MTDLFTQHAGKNVIRGAVCDEYGNASGTAYDLGADGAFRGLKIVVLQLYNFDFGNARAAMTQKGFEVVIYTNVPPASELQRVLQETSQLWLISTRTAILEEAHLDVIERQWRSGLGLYAFGDNEPFYVDVNRLLTRCGGLTMTGNSPGYQQVSKGNPGCPGFQQHLLTTGLITLFEGATIAYFDPSVVRAQGFQEVLRDHDNKLICIARPATREGCGPIIADGAFTKLFCNWDVAGSDRFVRNCACWLSAIVGEGGVEEMKSVECPVVDQEGRRDPRDIMSDFCTEDTAVVFTSITPSYRPCMTGKMLSVLRARYDNPKADPPKEIMEVTLDGFESDAMKNRLDEALQDAVTHAIHLQLAAFL